MLHFHTFEMKYGTGFAYHLLLEIEKAAHISADENGDFDPEYRLTHAQRVQNAVLYRQGYREAALQIAA